MRESSSKSSVSRRLRTLVLTLGIAATACQALLPVHAQPRLPTLGDGGGATTTSEERRLGDRIIRELYRDPDYLDDPVLQEYVEGIWLHLVNAARERGELSPELEERFAWEILLGRDRSINAFALPGGYLGVHLGLIGVVSTRDELASVLAHELSHVTQRHIARLIAQQGKQTPLMLGSMILGALAASRSPDAAMAMMMGGQALAVQNQLNFSRDMEREADRMGYGLMAPAGFAPQGFVSMFDKLQVASRINDNGSWPYLRSHPLTTERIADMHSRLPLGSGTSPMPAPTLEHVMMAARARVLSRPGVDVLRQWADLPRSTSFGSQPREQQVAQLYAAVLSAMQLRDWSVARDMLHRLSAACSVNPEALRQARLLQTELELGAGQPSAALAALEPVSQTPALPSADAKQNDPPLAGPSLATVMVRESRGPHRPELLLRTQVLLRQQSAAAMAGQLQTWVTDHPRDAQAWQLLAQVWGSQKQELRALRAEAEAHVAHYDYPAAVDRFKAAQELGRKSGQQLDYIEASIIDTRLRAVEELLREQSSEK
ncbi:M48 family metalloprotease [Comamonas composti]|uniref:M48 family metalloprotease n=1 Tax=Comamonas composti TaxID=408558 RepID=UPI00041B1E34|nr:M48 family metalloprotease [Comamonas composti]